MKLTSIRHWRHNETGNVALVVDRGRGRAGKAGDVDFAEAARLHVIGEAMVVAVPVGPETDRLVLVVHAQKLVNGHAAVRALAVGIDNVGEVAIVIDEAEVVAC